MPRYTTRESPVPGRSWIERGSFRPIAELASPGGSSTIAAALLKRQKKSLLLNLSRWFVDAFAVVRGPPIGERRREWVELEFGSDSRLDPQDRQQDVRCSWRCFYRNEFFERTLNA